MISSLPLSVLDLASVPTGATIAETYDRLVDYARTADELGYTRFWLAEHHNMEGIASSATSILINHIAQHTQSIRVGSGGIMLPNHPPLIVAEQFGTLDTLHPGRIDLGLGRAPGTDPLTSRALRRSEAHADNFPQEVSELQTLLGENDNKQVRAYPGSNSQVDIWILGSSLFSAQLAAEKGLPYAFAGHFAPTYAEEALTLYHRLFKPSDELKEPYAILCVPTVLADTDDEAEFLATSLYQRALALFRGHPLYLPPPVESMEGLWTAHERAQLKAFLSLALIGSAKTAKQKLEKLRERFQFSELMVTNDIFDDQRRQQALGLLKTL